MDRLRALLPFSLATLAMGIEHHAVGQAIALGAQVEGLVVEDQDQALLSTGA
jgi:hypothetical protein